MRLWCVTCARGTSWIPFLILSCWLVYSRLGHQENCIWLNSMHLVYNCKDNTGVRSRKWERDKGVGSVCTRDLVGGSPPANVVWSQCTDDRDELRALVQTSLPRCMCLASLRVYIWADVALACCECARDGKVIGTLKALCALGCDLVRGVGT
jgi:hypothetical protein